MEDGTVGEKFQRFFEQSLDLLCIAGFDGYFKELNGAWEGTLGYTVAELKSRPFVEFVHPDDRAATLRETEQLTRGADTIRFENRYRTSAGRYRWLEWRAAPSAEGEFIIASARDVTEQKAVTDELVLLQRVTKAIGEAPDLDTALLHALTAISVSAGWAYAEAWLAGSSGRLSVYAPVWYAGRPDLEEFRRRCERMRLHPAKGLIGQAVLAKDVAWVTDDAPDQAYLRKDVAARFGLHAAVAVPVVVGNTVVAVLAFFMEEESEQDQGFVDIVTHVTKQLGQLIRRRQTETEMGLLAERFKELSLVDELTGLPNRRAFLLNAEEKLRLAKREGTRLTLLFIDVDQMKTINDQLGHAEGDQALRDAGAVLRNSVRESDLAARLSGDEFAILLWGGEDAEQAVRKRLAKGLARHKETFERPYSLELSVGRTKFDPNKPVPLDTLMAWADAAMYERKHERVAKSVVISQRHGS
ncbi:MAG TPA: diguanylate cyclase [Actinomycetota bacterium]